MDGTGGTGSYNRDFWEKENLRYAEPHFRLRKVARVLRGLAGRREVDLLDVGCGPGTLGTLLPATVHYHGLDIAIQRPAANLVESDITREPVRFKGTRFDLVVAQSRVLGDIAGLLKDGGRLVCTYQNFAHRRPSVYAPYSYVRPPGDFHRELDRHFLVDRAFPTAYNWGHSHPRRTLVRWPQERLAVNVPVIGQRLAVDYCYVCSPRPR
jgi:SAM-dependent methyltransferase